MERHRTDVAAIQDFVHVLESLWKAAYCFHAHGTPEAETWVLERPAAITLSEHPAPPLGSIPCGCARFSPNPFSCNSSDLPCPGRPQEPPRAAFSAPGKARPAIGPELLPPLELIFSDPTPAPCDLTVPAAKARASGKWIRLGSVTREGCAVQRAVAPASSLGIVSVPQAHRKEVRNGLTNCVEATRKMRVGPSGSAFRSGPQTTPSLLRSRAVVVSVGVKASRTYLEQVRIRETNESEPSLTRRNPGTCRQNQGRFYLLGQACRAPDYWASGGRRIGGVKLIQASVWNCGNQSFRCQGRSPSGRNHEARVPMRSTGTDRPVRAMKAGNAAGAKGSDQAVAFGVQLATGGNG
jgi:hypothetical protein